MVHSDRKPITYSSRSLIEFFWAISGWMSVCPVMCSVLCFLFRQGFIHPPRPRKDPWLEEPLLVNRTVPSLIVPSNKIICNEKASRTPRWLSKTILWNISKPVSTDFSVIETMTLCGVMWLCVWNTHIGGHVHILMYCCAVRGISDNIGSNVCLNFHLQSANSLTSGCSLARSSSQRLC